MKKRVLTLALAALMLLALLVPAMAEREASFVYDNAGLLTGDELAALNARAGELSARYGIGIYAVTVEDYNDYGNGTVLDAAKEIYHGGELGIGDRRDGVLLLLSLRERDWALFAFGNKAERAVNADGRDHLAEAFLDDFGSGDWNSGLRDYIEDCGALLELAASGKPLRRVPVGKIVITVLVACAVALTVCLILKGRMKSVRAQRSAAVYVAPGGLTLTAQRDDYSHMTETRTRINDRDHDGGGGSGGGGGSSGKF